MEHEGLLGRVERSVRQFGVGRSFYDLSIRAVNKIVYCRVLKAVSIHEPDSKSLQQRPEYVYGFLSRDAVVAFAADPQYEMNPLFLAAALAKGDKCYGIVHGDTLASYGWYSTKATVALTDDLELSFDPAYAYMYKGFTHEAYRGQRLHAAGMAQALQGYRSDGCKGIVSYVESNNFSSLKSCYRMGYLTFGHVVVLKAGARYFIGATDGCRQRGFRLAPLVRT
jgi:hypothetical protein